MLKKLLEVINQNITLGKVIIITEKDVKLSMLMFIENIFSKKKKKVVL